MNFKKIIDDLAKFSGDRFYLCFRPNKVSNMENLSIIMMISFKALCDHSTQGLRYAY